MREIPEFTKKKYRLPLTASKKEKRETATGPEQKTSKHVTM